MFFNEASCIGPNHPGLNYPWSNCSSQWAESVLDRNIQDPGAMGNLCICPVSEHFFPTLPPLLFVYQTAMMNVKDNQCKHKKITVESGRARSINKLWPVGASSEYFN